MQYILQKIKDFFRLVFPSNGLEWLLFVFFLIVYGVFGVYIALHYRIIFDDRIPWDAYFSFDNRAIVMTGGGFERHPLSNYFFDTLRNFAFLFSNNQKNEVFRLVLALCCNFAVSLSLIQIFKYLRNIIGLTSVISLLLLFFFASFSTPILLSFTPETYTYTFLLLTLYNYYAAIKIKKNQEIPATALLVSGITIGGLTITNIIKIYIPILFQKKLFKSWESFGYAFLRMLISVIGFVLLYLYRLDFDYHKIFEKTGEQYEKFSKPKITPIWDMISSWFLGGNMLFSGFVVRDYHSKSGFQYKALFMDVYTSWVPYLFVAVVVTLVFWSYFKNFKNKYVQILMISFFVDVLIHAVLKFGLHTSYIYGGHFIFVVPLMLGWLFYSYKNSPKMLSILTVICSILFFYLVMNNLIRIEEFFRFLNNFYQ